MRKNLLKMLTVLLVLLMIPLIPAARAESLPYSVNTLISVQPLTASQRELINYLYPRLIAGTEKIDLPNYTKYDDVAPAMHCLLLDYPELFHVAGQYTITYLQSKPHIAQAVKVRYTMSSEKAREMRQRLLSEAQEMVRADPTPEGLHRQLLQAATYLAADPDTYATAVGALVEGQAVCEGYAKALTLLYRMAGIPCGVITGTGLNSQGQRESHAWNIALVEGAYTLIDTTWNDQERYPEGLWWYYGLSTEQMAADHTPDGNQDIPRCYDHANWHRVRGYLVESCEDFAALFGDFVQGGELNVRFTDRALYAEITGDLNGFIDQYNQLHPDAPFYGSYSYTTHPTQPCLLLRRAD